jgi:hypothetical protein
MLSSDLGRQTHGVSNTLHGQLFLEVYVVVFPRPFAMNSWLLEETHIQTQHRPVLLRPPTPSTTWTERAREIMDLQDFSKKWNDYIPICTKIPETSSIDINTTLDISAPDNSNVAC